MNAAQTTRTSLPVAGVGPFLELPPISAERYNYRARDVRPHIRVGLAQAGGVQIELIEVLTDGPSIYKDVFAFGETGHHHVCIFTDDIDKDITHHSALGLDIPVIGQHSELRFAFVDTRPTLGCMLEIVTDSAVIQAIYGAVRRASESWGGSDPIPPFAI
jgi:hypothetical protein